MSDSPIPRKIFSKTAEPFIPWTKCEHCGDPVEPPLPIHPKCGEIWLKGWHAREAAERQDFIDRATK